MSYEDQKIMRGDILCLIYNLAPSKVKETTITSTYYSYYEYKSILRGLGYLVNRGLIEKHMQEHPVTHKNEAFYTISADGMLVVEKTSSDRGIIVEEDN